MTENIEILKISFSRQLRAARYILIYFIIITIFLLFDGHDLAYNDPILYVSFVPVLLITLPALIVHIQYFIEDKGKSVELDNYKERMIIHHKNTHVTLDYNKIVSFTKVERNVESDYGLDWFPWASYFYYRVRYNDGKVYFITCLMTNKFVFSKVNNVSEDSIIPFLRVKDLEIIKPANSIRK